MSYTVPLVTNMTLDTKWPQSRMIREIPIYSHIDPNVEKIVKFFDQKIDFSEEPMDYVKVAQRSTRSNNLGMYQQYCVITVPKGCPGDSSEPVAATMPSEIHVAIHENRELHINFKHGAELHMALKLHWRVDEDSLIVDYMFPIFRIMSKKKVLNGATGRKRVESNDKVSGEAEIGDEVDKEDKSNAGDQTHFDENLEVENTIV